MSMISVLPNVPGSSYIVTWVMVHTGTTGILKKWINPWREIHTEWSFLTIPDTGRQSNQLYHGTYDSICLPRGVIKRGTENSFILPWRSHEITLTHIYIYIYKHHFFRGCSSAICLIAGNITQLKKRFSTHRCDTLSGKARLLPRPHVDGAAWCLEHAIYRGWSRIQPSRMRNMGH